MKIRTFLAKITALIVLCAMLHEFLTPFGVCKGAAFAANPIATSIVFVMAAGFFGLLLQSICYIMFLALFPSASIDNGFWVEGNMLVLIVGKRFNCVVVVTQMCCCKIDHLFGCLAFRL